VKGIAERNEGSSPKKSSPDIVLIDSSNRMVVIRVIVSTLGRVVFLYRKNPARSPVSAPLAM